MRYFFIILWLFVVVSGKSTARIERDHDSGKDSKILNGFSQKSDQNSGLKRDNS